MKKYGRPSKIVIMNEELIKQIYVTHLNIANNTITKNEGAENLRRFNIGKATSYALFMRMQVIEMLLNNEIDNDIINDIDTVLNIRDIYEVGKRLIEAEAAND